MIMIKSRLSYHIISILYTYTINYCFLSNNLNFFVLCLDSGYPNSAKSILKIISLKQILLTMFNLLIMQNYFFSKKRNLFQF